MAKRDQTFRAENPHDATPDAADSRADYNRILAEIAAQLKLVPLAEVKSIGNGNGASTPAGEVLYKLRAEKREAFLKLA